VLAVTITEIDGRVRLDLGGLARGEGRSLQEAADALIRRTLELALAYRASGFRACSEVRLDLETLSFLHEVADIAAQGGDIRARLFG
jgi:hypothetical protein